MVRGIVSESWLTQSKSICMSEAKEYYFMISMSLCILYLCAFWATRGQMQSTDWLNVAAVRIGEVEKQF